MTWQRPPLEVNRALRLGVGVFGLALLNIAVINAFPFLAGALIDQWHMDSMEVGLLISIELFVYAASAMALSAPSLRINPRLVGHLGCAAFATGNLLASGAETYGGLALTGGIAGFGGGLAVAAVGRAIAWAAIPARLLSYIGIPLSISGAALAMGAGNIVASTGYAGGCRYLAVVGGFSAILATFLPTQAPLVTSAPGSGRAYNWRGAILALSVSALVYLGSGAVWNFSERIGLSTGLDASAVAAAIGLTSLAGIAGALAAIAAARSQREFLWAAVASLLYGGSVCALALAESPLAYIVALGILSFAFIFTIPFLAAIAIRVDTSGGLAGAAQGVQMLAGAFAPFLGGVLLTVGSFRALAMLAITTSALAVLCIVGTRRSVHPAVGVVS